MTTLVSEENLADAATMLLSGGVALVPTDTVYGLAITPHAEAAKERVFAMKNRPVERNLPVMVHGEGGLHSLGVLLTDAALRLLESEYMPGPLTIAVGFDERCERPAFLNGRFEVAVRIPGNRLLRDLLVLTGPLLVTSANVSGGPLRATVTEILAELGSSPDLAIDGGVLSLTPSTLVNCRLDPPVIERLGVVGRAQIAEVLPWVS